ncbi:PHD finger protein MALE MEIOCYTE DEATH 1 [Spatholobus suberectus]|nr:PHD finger protein MALE MEIOCYTE DEATH 1 [Spatholobus suberectus]
MDENGNKCLEVDVLADQVISYTGDSYQWEWPFVMFKGINGGSKTLNGREITKLWDRICTTLYARKNCSTRCSKEEVYGSLATPGVAFDHSWFWRCRNFSSPTTREIHREGMGKKGKS